MAFLSARQQIRKLARHSQRRNEWSATVSAPKRPGIARGRKAGAKTSRRISIDTGAIPDRRSTPCESLEPRGPKRATRPPRSHSRAEPQPAPRPGGSIAPWEEEIPIRTLEEAELSHAPRTPPDRARAGRCSVSLQNLNPYAAPKAPSRKPPSSYRKPPTEMLNEPQGRLDLRFAGTQRHRGRHQEQVRRVQRAGLGGADQSRARWSRRSNSSPKPASSTAASRLSPKICASACRPNRS